MSMYTRSFLTILLVAPAIMLAATVHEATRALISTLLGDETPKREGRLTLNPFSHFEPIGFLLMYSTGLNYGIGVGWGKPANTNSRRYKNRRTGIVLTAVWPSLANFIVAVIFANIISMAGSMPWMLADFLNISISYNISMVVCNLLPVTPFDCMKIVMEFVSRKNYFSISQSESVMQLIMILLLFGGLLTMVLSPVANVLYAMLKLLTF